MALSVPPPYRAPRPVRLTPVYLYSLIGVSGLACQAKRGTAVQATESWRPVTTKSLGVPGSADTASGQQMMTWQQDSCV